MIFPLLADIAVSPVQMGVFVGCLIAFLGLMAKISSLKKDLISDVLTTVAARRGAEAQAAQAAQAAHIPQPIVTREHEVFVVRESFYKHAELNRTEHERIERKLDTAVQSISSDVSEIAVTAAETKVLREANHEAIRTLNNKFDDLANNFHDLSGAVHQALKAVPVRAVRAHRKAA